MYQAALLPERVSTCMGFEPVQICHNNETLECMSDKVCPFLQKYSEYGNVGWEFQSGKGF